MFTRREFGMAALGALGLPIAGAAQATAPAAGITFGIQSYSFRALPRAPGGDASDALVEAFVDVGLTDCELWSPQIEPLGVPARGSAAVAARNREALREWRIVTPIEHFRTLAAKFRSAGITISAFNYSFDRSFTDPEIDRGFEMARALGAEVITASTTLDVAARLVPFAERHRLLVAMHNHSNTADANEFATPESFAAARRLSDYFRINLDIGHFTAANYDAVAFIREHHASITNLHLKDRRRNQGDNVRWGAGDTPIHEVVRLIERERWPIRAHIEYEYRGTRSPVDEVKRCVAYARKALT